MVKKMGMLLMILGLAFYGFTAVAMAYGFSADVISTSHGHVNTGKIFWDYNKMRMESEMEKQKDMVTIVRMDKKLIWILMPTQKMYMERMWQEQAQKQYYVPTAIDEVRSDIERVFICVEKYDGRDANKYKVTVTYGNEKHVHVEWYYDGIVFPVKVAAEDASWMHEYKNIVLGPPPAELFEVPVGYTKMEIPGFH